MKTEMRRYHAAELCVLPARRAEKRPVGKWKRFQKRLPTEAELSAWMANDLDAICILTGKISGNLEMIDFDNGGELFDAWSKRIPTDILQRLVIEETQSGGWHVIYRCETQVCGNLKLAQRADGDKLITLIETRGQGGLFLCAPTAGYELMQGDLAAPPLLTEDQRDALLQAAWELNEYAPPVVDGPKAAPNNGRTAPLSAHSADNSPLLGHQANNPPTSAHNGDRPGDDFNNRGDVRDVLEKHEWTCTKGGENEYWRRPGKTSGTSATLKERVFYVFSSNAAPFEPNEAYSPFAVYAMLEHAGDFSTATRALSAQGFGQSEHLHTGVDISGIVGTPAEILDSDADNGENESDTPDIVDPGPFPAHLLENLPDLVQTAMEYYVTNAIDVQSVVFLASFIAATGTILGHKVKDSSGLRTNIYTVGVLGTGGGKEATRETVSRIFHRAGIGPMCGAEDFASDSGMITAISLQNPILFQIDEFGRLMHSIQLGAKRSPHLYNIVSILLKLFSKANGTYRSKAYADAKRNIRIDNPHVCVFGSTVVGNFWEALNYEAVKDGFLPRLLIFESNGEAVDGRELDTDPPEELVNFFAYWARRRVSSGNLEDAFPRPMIVPYCPEAAEMMKAFRAEQKREQVQYDELGPLWSRARENAGKLALIHACWKNPEHPTVETDSAQWAVELTRHLVRQTLWRANMSLVDNPFHAECQKVLRILQNAPNGEMPHSKLLRQIRTKAKDFRDLIETLRQRRDIETLTKSTAGRPGVFYRITKRRGAA